MVVALAIPVGLPAATCFTRGPFVQNATTNSIQIAWRTTNAASTFVEFGSTPALGTLISNAALLTNHLVPLANLAADHSYFYRAGSDDGSGLIVSVPTPIRTLKPTGAIRFQVIGDSPAAAPSVAAVANAMRARPADLVLHCGDIVYYGMSESNVNYEFFRFFQPHMQSVPYYLVAGNHDLDWPTELTGLSFQDTFFLPTNSATGTEQFYSFDHGDVHFVGLFSPWFRDYRFTAATPQFAWLTNDLAQSPKPWKVMFLHTAIASSSTHGFDDYDGNGLPDTADLMALLLPPAQRYGVQMIFGCHDHDYERFAPTNGVHHLCTGGGGKGPPYTVISQHGASAQFWPTFEFLQVSVTNQTMLVEAVDTNGVVFDSVSIAQTAPERQLRTAAWHSPVVETGPANDGDGNINGQWFDFAGPPLFAVAGQFSNLGRVYVNNDWDHLYVGIQEATFYRGNNVFLFLASPRRAGVTRMAGLGNGIVDPNGQGVDGLDFLKNLSFTNFSPCVACLLGDEYADRQFRSFARSNLALNIGQGVFSLDASFSDVPGTRVQQFNRSPQTNVFAMSTSGIATEQNADYMEVAIPLASLGQLQPGDTIKIGAVVGGVAFDLANPSRQLDSGFLGYSLSGSGLGPVVLEGLPIKLAGEFRMAIAPLPPARLRLTWEASVGQKYQVTWSPSVQGPFHPINNPDLPKVATRSPESYDLELATPGQPPASGFYRMQRVP